MATFPNPPNDTVTAPGKRSTLIRWGLLLVVIFGGLVRFCMVEAARYDLVIPIQTATPETAQVYFAASDDYQEADSSVADLVPAPEPVAVRFPVRGKTVDHLRFDPTMTANAITVGVPRLRCEAVAFLGRFAPTSEVCGLEDIVASRQIRVITREGRFAHIVPEAGASDPSCVIRLARPLRLGFSASAFWTLLLPLTLVVGLLAALVWYGAKRTFSLLQPLPDALPEDRAAAVPRWEKISLLAVFLVSALVQINAIAHDGAMGQDYPYNFDLSKVLVQHPQQPMTFEPTNPPGFPLINAGILWLTGGVHSEAMCGLFNAALNLVALWVFTLLARRFIRRPVWRVALLVLVAFLPLRLIHTVVIAADALTLLPMFVLAWLLVRLTDEAVPPSRRRALALGAGALLAVSLVIKYTFLSAVVAVALTLLQLVRRRRVPWREGMLLAALALFLPLALIVAGRLRQPGFTSGLYLSGGTVGYMSYGDILAVRRVDLHVFDAPPWDEPQDRAKRALFNGTTADPGPPYELLTRHRHGFLALNHLAIFTDPVNIFQYDPTDAYFGQRSARNQRRMALATRTALPITLGCIVCVGMLTVAGCLYGVFRPGLSRADVESTLLLALGWLGNIVVFLPLVNVDPYMAGLWDPRQTMAAMLLFLLLTAFLLDRQLKGKVGEIAGWVILAYVLCQSALHVSFLWPWGKM